MLYVYAHECRMSHHQGFPLQDSVHMDITSQQSRTGLVQKQCGHWKVYHMRRDCASNRWFRGHHMLLLDGVDNCRSRGTGSRVCVHMWVSHRRNIRRANGSCLSLNSGETITGGGENVPQQFFYICHTTKRLKWNAPYWISGMSERTEH